MAAPLRRGASAALLALGSAVAVLALLELALAWLAPVPHLALRNVHYVPDPWTGYRVRPNPPYVNGLGFMDDEVEIEKPAGLRRVLVIGDSFGTAMAFSRKLLWTERLEELLETSATEPVEVVNASVGGWHPYQYAQYYEHEGRRLDPDVLVVALFVGNDAFSRVDRLERTRTAVLGNQVRRDRGESVSLWVRAKVWLYEHSHLVRRLVNPSRPMLAARPPPSRKVQPRDHDRFRPSHLAVQRRRMALVHRPDGPDTRRRAANAIAQIERIAARAKADGVPMLVVLLPDENQINGSLARAVAGDGAQLGRFDLDMPQSMLRETFSELGIETYDLLPDFRAHAHRLYMDDTHWNPDGHAFAAEKVLPCVARHLGSPRRKHAHCGPRSR